MKKSRPGARTTRGALKSLDGIVRPMARVALKNHNTLWAQVLLDWPLIVSERYASVFSPTKTRFNPKTNETILTLETASPQGAFILRYEHERILQEITSFFGGPVIHNLHVVSGKAACLKPGGHQPQGQDAPPLSLEDALQALGRHLIKTP